jgi:hypothetical protein
MSDGMPPDRARNLVPLIAIVMTVVVACSTPADQEPTVSASVAAGPTSAATVVPTDATTWTPRPAATSTPTQRATPTPRPTPTAPRAPSPAPLTWTELGRIPTGSQGSVGGVRKVAGGHVAWGTYGTDENADPSFTTWFSVDGRTWERTVTGLIVPCPGWTARPDLDSVYAPAWDGHARVHGHLSPARRGRLRPSMDDLAVHSRWPNLVPLAAVRPTSRRTSVGCVGREHVGGPRRLGDPREHRRRRRDALAVH